jgi:arylformamidase
VQILDVSMAIRPGMPIWPGDPALEVGLADAIADGAEANVTRLALGAHTGTQVDAPAHFLDGAAGVETVPLDALVGPCLVVEADDVHGELPAASVPAGAERVLFRTRNGALWERDGFVEGSVCLSAAAAEEVVRRGIRLVGIDYLTIGGPEAHRILLAAGVVPVEGLDLRAVEPGEYGIACLPRYAFWDHAALPPERCSGATSLPGWNAKASAGPCCTGTRPSSRRKRSSGPVTRTTTTAAGSASARIRSRARPPAARSSPSS